MGTRAAFFVGDPRDVEGREWLGCIAWDGYPGGGIDPIGKARSVKKFRAAVAELQSAREDFADPAKGGWPFPWDDDLFLTDHVYAFFDNKVQCSAYHSGLVSYKDLAAGDYLDEDNPDLAHVPAPGQYDTKQPDSIMILSVPYHPGVGE